MMKNSSIGTEWVPNHRGCRPLMYICGPNLPTDVSTVLKHRSMSIQAQQPEAVPHVRVCLWS